MKKILLILTALVFLCSAGTAFAESGASATYRRLSEQILTVLDVSGSGADTLRADTATVWTESDAVAGFLFDGAGWSVRGKADMATGLITSVICRLPCSSAGLLMAHAVLFAISGKTDPADYLATYVSDNALLNGTPFPDYKNTLDAGTSDTLIFEFIRTSGLELADENEACDMNRLIKLMQKQQ